MCTRATAPDSTRDGQGWEGYDTSHDTKFRAVRGRPKLSSSAAVGWRSRLSTGSHSPNFYFFVRERGVCDSARRVHAESPLAQQLSMSVNRLIATVGFGFPVGIGL